VLGLGARENSIPGGQEPDIRGEPRTVEIGWHPVAGFAGKWFAEKTGLGRRITEKLNRCPDPTQHWAVLVGGYAHELWMDEHLDVIYVNERVVPGEWHTFEVGKTRFNDEALRQAGMCLPAYLASRFFSEPVLAPFPPCRPLLITKSIFLPFAKAQAK